VSMAIAHFSFGAALTGLLIYVLRPGMRYSRSVALLGGIWAMLPDVQHISPVYHEELARFHDSAIVDVFWGHRFLDLADPGDTAEVAAVAVGFLFLVSVLLETHSRRRLPDLVVDIGVAHADFPAVTAIRRLAALTTLVAGAGMIALPVVRDDYVGLLVASGAILGLTGLGILFEDAALRRLSAAVIPEPIRTATKLVVSLFTLALATALLSTVPQWREVTIAYGALGLVLLIQLIRLWAPSGVLRRRVRAVEADGERDRRPPEA